MYANVSAGGKIIYTKSEETIVFIWMRQKAQAPYTDPPAGHIAIPNVKVKF